MASLVTTEICDVNAGLLFNGDLQVLPPIFKIYGQCRAFSGPITTLKVLEDNVLVKEVLKTPGEGRVLVLDGAGSIRCAILGGKLATLAHKMGWEGVLVNGCIRDVDDINGCDIGIRALASIPRRRIRKVMAKNMFLFALEEL